ncbi:PAS domain-containing protein [Hydrogenophaga palleronii]|uniref:PAS domain-containing protein n=1 Tax=Hydrogenophaga palleronii TaxID=65655 RepID=A0ABU1WRC3_9BURK|nr:PAS domain-containing protein [Hydrogenophaga palleronii]MDR7151582.1 PAS domain-containing protein [Hydrogenophaga palleronii]
MTKLTGGVRSNLSRASPSEALGALFKLASSPDTASDALAMLHELQVHQVEVEMQQDELRRSRVELERNLIQQTTRVEHAPAAFLVVDRATVVNEINLAGVRLLGAARPAVLGRPLSGFLAPSCSDALQRMLTRARDGTLPEPGELQLLPKGGVGQKLLCTAGRGAASGQFDLVLMMLPSKIQGSPSV